MSCVFAFEAGIMSSVALDSFAHGANEVNSICDPILPWHQWRLDRRMAAGGDEYRSIASTHFSECLHCAACLCQCLLHTHASVCSSKPAWLMTSSWRNRPLRVEKERKNDLGNCCTICMLGARPKRLRRRWARAVFEMICDCNSSGSVN